MTLTKNNKKSTAFGCPIFNKEVIMSEETEIKMEPKPGVEKIVFKKKQRKNLRQRRDSNNEDEEKDAAASGTHTTLEEIRLNQKMRGRPKGVSLIGLALGKKIAPEEEINIDNPFQISKIGGGLVNMHALKSGKLKDSEDAYDVGIGTQFSAETNKRDEDEEMMKYIEQELQKRKGNAENGKSGHEKEETQKYLTPEEAALFAVPESLRKSSSQRSEEMLSNQMLNGIPEVDLGIEAKIKNIEATEDAKQKLIRDQKNKKDGPSQFVPTNMAVNFMQHNRFNFGDNQEIAKRYSARNVETQKTQPTTTAAGVKRATDDYHYDKFKKQFRRF